MKISTKGRYGLRILLDLALHQGEKPRMIHDIAQSQQLSEKYISRLVLDLREAGMVNSIRGSRGGYRLARPPRDLTVLDIVEVMEGSVNMVDCVKNPGSCKRLERCAARGIWSKLNEEIRSSLRSVTLQDILEEESKLQSGEHASNCCF